MVPTMNRFVSDRAEKFPGNPCDGSTQRWMVTIVWNLRGIQIIRVLPNGCTFDSSYYQSEMPKPFSERRSGQAGAAGGTLIVHADNTRRHTAAESQQFMEENMMVRAPYPPYSPDLTPSDFDLFGLIKHCLRGQSFEAFDALF
jgi:hypothetical protein